VSLINPSGADSTTPLSTGIIPRLNKGRMGTALNERGFNYCGQNYCRDCPKLNKRGQIKSTTTEKHTTV